MIALLSSLFGALLCFAFLFVPAGQDIAGCKAVAALVQFFFLATLTWSNSMAISIIRKLYTLEMTSDSKKQFIFYSLYSFGFPFACTIITFILSTFHISTFEDEVYQTESNCFLAEKIVISVLFLVPAYLLIISNFIIGIVVMVRVARSGRIGASQDKNKLKKNAITCFKVSACLGIGWILLLITIYDSSFNTVMQIFIELQGLLIVISNIIGWNCLTTVRSWSTSADKSKSSSSSPPTRNRRTEIMSMSTS